MNYLGNYVNWINNYWIEYMLSVEGRYYPVETKKDFDIHALRQVTNAKRDINNPICIFYDNENTDFVINPIWTDSKHSEYWFVKLYPGMMQPLHQDEIPKNNTHKRYWVALQDYEFGHVFLYNNTILTDYKKGDVYMYDDSSMYHAAGNMGFNTRLSLNIATWD